MSDSNQELASKPSILQIVKHGEHWCLELVRTEGDPLQILYSPEPFMIKGVDPQQRGTIEARFNGLVKICQEYFNIDPQPFSSEGPETRILEAMRKQPVLQINKRTAVPPPMSQLEIALQKVMERLTDLLNEDQFNNIEAIVREAGVRYPDECPTVPRASFEKYEAGLAYLYGKHPFDVAHTCDELIDRSGGLLGRVRTISRTADETSAYRHAVTCNASSYIPIGEGICSCLCKHGQRIDSKFPCDDCERY